MTFNKGDRVCIGNVDSKGTVVHVARDGEVAVQLDQGGKPMYYRPIIVFLIEEGENEVGEGWTHPYTLIQRSDR